MLFAAKEEAAHGRELFTAGGGGQARPEVSPRRGRRPHYIGRRLFTFEEEAKDGRLEFDRHQKGGQARPEIVRCWERSPEVAGGCSPSWEESRCGRWLFANRLQRPGGRR